MPTRPITGPLTRSLSGGVTGVGAIGRLLSPPAGFDWAAPVSVIQSGTTYSTNFNANDWKVAATADVWVSPTGSDTVGTGAQGAPYRSISKGLQAALALPDSAVNLYVAAGTYNRLAHWNGQKCNKHLNIVAVGGRVVCSAKFEPLSWTLHSPGVYKAARSSVGGVWDEAFTEASGAKRRLEKKALLADCEAIANSWYTDGVTVYAHTTDGRVPDASVIVVSTLQNAVFDVDKQWYIENFDFEGGANPFNTQAGTIGPGSRLVFNGCNFRYGSPSTNGMSITGVPLVISNECAAYSNEADGFNYHGGTLETKAIEIRCTAYANGVADNNDNGSTSHEANRVIRVGGTYYASAGPVVIDINTAKSWNLGCVARDSTGTADGNSAFRAQDSAVMWLDGCSATGCTFATSINLSAAIYTRSLTYDGTLHGATDY